jgi:hypothetical protein
MRQQFRVGFLQLLLRECRILHTLCFFVLIAACIFQYTISNYASFNVVITCVYKRLGVSSQP